MQRTCIGIKGIFQYCCVWTVSGTYTVVSILVTGDVGWASPFKEKPTQSTCTEAGTLKLSIWHYSAMERTGWGSFELQRVISYLSNTEAKDKGFFPLRSKNLYEAIVPISINGQPHLHASTLSCFSLKGQIWWASPVINILKYLKQPHFNDIPLKHQKFILKLQIKCKLSPESLQWNNVQYIRQRLI